jgi:hypothetical protein
MKVDFGFCVELRVFSERRNTDILSGWAKMMPKYDFVSVRVTTAVVLAIFFSCDLIVALSADCPYAYSNLRTAELDFPEFHNAGFYGT